MFVLNKKGYMQTIVVTGGTGLVGRALCKMLEQKGYQVIVLSRNAARKANGNVRYANWDVQNQTIDLQAIQSADYIVHLAGAGVVDKKWTKKYKKEIVESRTQSSQLLVHTLKANHHKVKAIISASAIGWYGADVTPIKEFTETDPASTAFLGDTCRLWEESIDKAAEVNIRVCKIRTGIVLSNEGGALAEFKKPIKAGIAAILGSGKQMISWIHIEDLCRIFIQAIENESMNGSYNAVAPIPVNNKTLTLTLAKAMRGKFFIPLYVPIIMLKLILGGRSIEVLKSTTVSCEKIKKTGFLFLFPTIEAAIKQLTSSKL